jgi:OHCU decarboxylase
MNRYPRDLRGYGPSAPDPRWPKAARIAISLVLNYEEGGENSILHGDCASEAFLSEIVGAQPWPGQRHWNMDSLYDYGARAGFWRLHRLFRSLNLPITVFGVATALARSPEQVAAMQSANWEIASHGLKWVEHKDMPEPEERAAMAAAIRLHEQITGSRPRGWYTGRCSANTVRLAAQEGGFDWLSDAYDDDLPYWLGFSEKPQLVIPYTLDANDMRFATPQGFNTADHFAAYLIDTFDALYAEGVAGAAKMMSVGLHCRLIGRPGRINGLRRFLQHARNHEGVWFATRAQIAQHWAEQNPPPQPDLRPSQMGRAEFISRFGGVFEHSPWIAERAFEQELGPAHDSAIGLHSLLARMFRAATPEERLAVLRAHPDLAGKLAQAKRLTASSRSEQHGAGLGALTDQERSQFEALNQAYTERHGFPFIIAVRDHTKASILDAFQRRIAQSSLAETAEACAQVERITLLRLKDLLA